MAGGASPGGALSRAVMRDAAWYGSAGAIAKVLALLTVPVLTRALEPKGYGLVDLATSTAALLTLIALLSADIPAARLSSLASDTRARSRALSSYVWLVGGAGVLIAVLMLPLAPLLAQRAWSEPAAGSLALLTLILVPVSALQSALAQTQRITSRARTFAFLELTDLVAQLGLAVLFVLLGFGPHGVLLGFILGSVLGLVAAAAAATTTLRALPDWGVALSIGLRGAQLLPYAVAFVVGEWLVRAILANSDGVPAVADFGVAVRLASALTLVGAAFALAWGPIGLSRERGPDTARLFARALVAYGFVSLAAAVTIGAVGPELVRILAGDEYLGAAVILPALALAAAFAGTEYVLVVAASLGNNGRLVALGSLAGAATQVAATAALVQSHGIGAVGPAALIGRALSFSIMLVGTRRDVTYRPLALVAVGLGAALVAVTLQVAISLGAEPQWPRWLLAAAIAAAGAGYTLQRAGLRSALR